MISDDMVYNKRKDNNNPIVKTPADLGDPVSDQRKPKMATTIAILASHFIGSLGVLSLSAVVLSVRNGLISLTPNNGTSANKPVITVPTIIP